MKLKTIEKLYDGINAYYLGKWNCPGFGQIVIPLDKLENFIKVHFLWKLQNTTDKTERKAIEDLYTQMSGTKLQGPTLTMEKINSDLKTD